MAYYKHLDLDYEPVVKKLRSYTLDNIDQMQRFWNPLDTTEILSRFPEIQKMFDPLNITIKMIALINARPGHNQIHRDNSKENVRINLPVLNCEHSTTIFYRSDDEGVPSVTSNGRPFLDLNTCKFEFVESFCLDRPAAINVNEPHQLVIEQRYLPRVAWTVAFVENIDYLLD